MYRSILLNNIEIAKKEYALYLDKIINLCEHKDCYSPEGFESMFELYKNSLIDLDEMIKEMITLL